MKTHNFSTQEVKQLDMVDYLERSGHSPKKITGNDYWYLSPLRMEKEPSFKVNRKLNVWYDHGLGKGGSLIDFGILYHGCSVKDLLEKITGNDFSFHQQISKVNNLQSDEGKIKIKEVRSIQSPALMDYLKERAIPLDIAKIHCRELHYEVHGKKYTAIGFKNNSGGFELRNRHFKGSSSPKDATLIREEGATALTVIEGFFSFLSLLASPVNASLPPTDYLVLNSLSFIEKNRDRMESYPETILLLDNDLAGDQATSKLLTRSLHFKDHRELYRGYKDLNHSLLELDMHIKKQQELENKISFSHSCQRTERRIH
jgi:DNA primase